MRNDRSVALNRRSLLATGAAGLLLSACGDIIGPPAAPQIYVLRPVLPPLPPGPKVDWALAIDLPETVENLNSDRLAISRTANTQDYFANAAWTDKLPPLVQATVITAFEASGRIDQVVRDTDGVRTDYLLKIDIRDFEARYDQPDAAPTAQLSFAVSLVDRSDRNLAARLSVKQEAAATQNRVEAYVEAMDHALGTALVDIVRWALSAVPQTSEPTPKPRRRH